MYWIWLFLFASQPALLFLGLLDFLGKEAKKAAEDIMPVYAVAGVLFAIGLAIYLGLKAFGLTNA